MSAEGMYSALRGLLKTNNSNLHADWGEGIHSGAVASATFQTKLSHIDKVILAWNGNSPPAPSTYITLAVTLDPANNGQFSVQKLLHTSTSDGTLIASTGSARFMWIAFGKR